MLQGWAHSTFLARGKQSKRGKSLCLQEYDFEQMSTFLMGISDLCRIAIIDYVIIHNKSFELILTEDLLKK